MPRQARLDAPGILHHVMIRGIEGRNIFINDGDRENFLPRVYSKIVINPLCARKIRTYWNWFVISI